jgi:hypothetical protein
VDERVVRELHDLVNGVDRRPIPVRLDRSALRARKSSLRHRKREWSVLLSPAPALANILRVRGMKSLQPEADGISHLLSANERNSNGSQEISEGDC